MSLLISCKQQATTSFSITTIPDPKAIDGGYVSNPDSIITPSTVTYLNEQLRPLATSGKAKVAVVLLNSIADQVPKDVAHELFNYWKVGEKGTRNGLLILVVKDQRRVEFETGYGLEGELPDITCFQIQQEYMVPYFKQNNFDSAVIKGIEAITRQLNTDKYSEPIPTLNDTVYEEVIDSDESTLTDTVQYEPLENPSLDAETKKAIRQEQKTHELFRFIIVFFFYLFFLLILSVIDEGDAKQKEEKEKGPVTIFKNELYPSSVYTFFFLGCIPVAAFVILTLYTSLPVSIFVFLGVVYSCWSLFVHGYYIFLRFKLAMRYKQLSRLERYSKLDHLHRNLKAFTFLFPLPFLVLYRMIHLKKMSQLRNTPYICKCGCQMHKLDEKADDVYLNKGQVLEESLGSVDYDVWLCSACSETLILYYVDFRSKLRICNVCSAKTLRQTKKKTIERATETSTGLGRKYFTCSNCKATKEIDYIIPVLRSSSSSSGSSSSSSSSSSDSWGGGSSGGGGAGSSW